MRPSLFGLEAKHVVDLYVLFSNRRGATARWWKLLEDGFQHVEIWKPVGLGLWVRIDPCLECMDFGVYMDPPWVAVDPRLKPRVMRVQRVIPGHRVREPFTAGPVTCVELAKAALGMRDFFVRTPYQLYKALRREGHE